MNIISFKKNMPLKIQFIVGIVLFLSACSSPLDNIEEIKWPQLGTPCQWVDVNTQLLEVSSSVVDPQQLNPYASKPTPPETLARLLTDNHEELLPGIIAHQYDYMTVMGHYFATGTTVYFIVSENEFYMLGDDAMNHIDGMVGPFSGNPTDELPPTVSFTEGHQGYWGKEECEED